ncbi:hypothetical protein TNIN_271071 [Trichonephila inaurata madagascariensis]|uniref:Uncharacterized protein n=1 Tax=Trichonephila inaurata madagascariensis TaxID=2747483 RepID=A0A8X6WM34_9ARAC|nr:hypothetical protein TNIN_271071 [Trichonephila inaurata madagascariensis]
MVYPTAAEYDLQHPVLSLGCQERHLPYLSGTRPARKVSHPGTQNREALPRFFPQSIKNLSFTNCFRTQDTGLRVLKPQVPEAVA